VLLYRVFGNKKKCNVNFFTILIDEEFVTEKSVLLIVLNALNWHIFSSEFLAWHLISYSRRSPAVATAVVSVSFLLNKNQLIPPAIFDTISFTIRRKEKDRLFRVPGKPAVLNRFYTKNG
jgi:hypothetical protein